MNNISCPCIRIIGDCLSDVVRQVAMHQLYTWGQKAALVIVDPPYGLGKEKWDKGDPRNLIKSTLTTYSRMLEVGGSIILFGGIGRYRQRVFFDMVRWAEDSGLVMRDMITWRKRRAFGRKEGYLFVREEIAWLTHADEPLRCFNVPYLAKERGYEGYNAKYPAKSKYLRRGNVWDDVTEMFRGKVHPTQKPQRLYEILIETHTMPGDVVIDPMAGSFVVEKAAEKLGRRVIAIDKEDCVGGVANARQRLPVDRS